jgi:hypothetical protein
MIPRVDSPISNTETEQAPPTCPKRAGAPTAKVVSADNAADLELSSHRRAHEAAKASLPTAPATKPTKRKAPAPIPQEESSVPARPAKKRVHEHVDDLPADAVDADGFLEDVQVLDIDEPSKPHREQRSRDIDALFSAPYAKDGKKVRDCNMCT